MNWGLAEAAKLEKAEPVRAAEELTATAERLRQVKAADALPADLKAGLVRIVGQAIDGGRSMARDAIRADRFRAAAEAADKLSARLLPAAKLADLSADVMKFQQSCRFLAELAEKAGQPDPPEPGR